jgi:hypothetical protein
MAPGERQVPVDKDRAPCRGAAPGGGMVSSSLGLRNKQQGCCESAQDSLREPVVESGALGAVLSAGL